MKPSELVVALKEALPEGLEPRAAYREPPDWARRAREAELLERLEPGDGLTVDEDEWTPPDVSALDREVQQRGHEALAWYEPFHFWPDGDWGIYIREKGVQWLLSRLHAGSPAAMTPPMLARVAYLVLRKHELFHFLTEAASTFLELARRQPLYCHYLRKAHPQPLSPAFPTPLHGRQVRRWTRPFPSLTAHEAEEALANAYAVRTLTNVSALNTKPRPVLRTLEALMSDMPAGYRHFQLFRADGDFTDGRQALGWAIAGTENFYEMLFDGHPPRGCLEEVPTFVVADYPSLKGALQFLVNGGGVALHPSDHPPVHIHVRVPKKKKQQRYTYPGLQPVGKEPPLTGKTRKRVEEKISRHRKRFDDRADKLRKVAERQH